MKEPFDRFSNSSFSGDASVSLSVMDVRKWMFAGQQKVCVPVDVSVEKEWGNLCRVWCPCVTGCSKWAPPNRDL